MKEPTRQRVDLVRETTGCSVDEAESALRETGNDVNEAVVRIIENPFTTFQTKKQKKRVKDDERVKKDNSKVIEVRRPSMERGSRRDSRERSRGGGAGGDRGFDRAARGARAAAQPRPEAPPQEEVAPSGTEWADAADEAEVPAPVQRPNFSRAPGQSMGVPPPVPIRPGAVGAGVTMADLFKAKPAAGAAAAAGPGSTAAPGSSRQNLLPSDDHLSSSDQGLRGPAQPAGSSSFASADTATRLLPPDTATSPAVGAPT
ncbi:hypothetical protein WJX84_001557, partial [Apatococcus fuscideae]